MTGAIVLGCGVSGLSTGIRLLEAGFSVRIWARDLPPNTTSNVAAAIWYPYKAYPVERVTGWGQRSFEVFSELAHDPDSGVRMLEALEVFGEPAPDPWWRECVRVFRRAALEELPPGYLDGYLFETPMVEMRLYLPYLLERFRELGGEIERREVRVLEDALGECDLVANCTGLGSLELLRDTELFPIRGQIVRVEPPPVGRAYLDESEVPGVAYIVPRSTDCILGGTAVPDDWSIEPDSETARDIVSRCARLAPEVASASVVEHLVGLRPGRNAVRLEVERYPAGKLVVHNYGHGGAGVTLSWGCAEEVVALAQGSASH